MAFDAVATMGAFARGIPRIIDAPDEFLMTEIWRTLAYLVFAGLWTMLALEPRRQRGVWELVLLHKIAFTLFAIVLFDKPEAAQSTLVDAILVVTTVAAYFLCRGWYGWRRPTPAPVEQAVAA